MGDVLLGCTHKPDGQRPKQQMSHRCCTLCCTLCGSASLSDIDWLAPNASACKAPGLTAERTLKTVLGGQPHRMIKQWTWCTLLYDSLVLALRSSLVLPGTNIRDTGDPCMSTCWSQPVHKNVSEYAVRGIWPRTILINILVVSRTYSEVGVCIQLLSFQ